jgi:protein TonB
VLYILLGFTFILLLSWQALEYETKTIVTENVFKQTSNATDVEEIPITQLLVKQLPPPPPPPPAIIDDFKEVPDDKKLHELPVIPQANSKPHDDEQHSLAPADVPTEAGVEDVIPDVPFILIEQVPIYPGCEDMQNNDHRRKCMNEKINKHINKNFNTNIASDYGLNGIQKIQVQLKIDHTGVVTDIIAVSNHSSLQKEATRVVSSLPTMIPGRQRNKAVGVIYSLPIVFQVNN